MRRRRLGRILPISPLFCRCLFCVRVLLHGSNRASGSDRHSARGRGSARFERRFSGTMGFGASRARPNASVCMGF